MPLSFAPSLAEDRASAENRALAEDLVSDRLESVPRIFDAPPALGLWHLISLDAPTVAVAWAMAFAWVGRARLPLWVPLLVALVTWSVYVADRLLDAFAGLREAARHRLRERHFFHWRYRRVLLLLAIVAACAAAGIVAALMPPMTRARDSVLAAAALAYFSGVHSARHPRPLRLRWPRFFPGKEFLVGVLFTAGCVLPAWQRTHAIGFRVWAFWIPAAGFAALAWLNCMSIARWEWVDAAVGSGNESSLQCELARQRFEAGAKHNPKRTAVCGSLSPRSLGVLALALAAIEFLLSIIAAAALHPRPAALLAAGAVSALLLALLDRARTRMTPLALRSAADLVLLTPAPLLLLAWVLR